MVDPTVGGAFEKDTQLPNYFPFSELNLAVIKYSWTARTQDPLTSLELRGEVCVRKVRALWSDSKVTFWLPETKISIP